MQFLYLGGPGRSGTSYLARRLGAHHQVATFPEIELKFLTEKDGLLDLYLSLVEHYSPNRAMTALAHFKRLTHALISGQFGQPGFADMAERRLWIELFDTFCEALSPSDFPSQLDRNMFLKAARHLLNGVAELAVATQRNNNTCLTFLEKTPHALLSSEFLSDITPEAQFIHVMRDPRSIAQSLCRMPWGPDDLATSCDWVASYCAAWQSHRAFSTTPEHLILEIRIEEIVGQPIDWANRLTNFLGLEAMEDLLAGSHLSTLNRWTSRCERGDLRLLRNRLDVWALEMGYLEAEIGGVDPSSIRKSLSAVSA